MGNCLHKPPPKPPGGLPPVPELEDFYPENDYRRSSLKPKQKTVIALYSFKAREEGELSFEKGDRLIILDDNEPDWWLAKKLNFEKYIPGYIPVNFVVENVIETEEWFFGEISRREAEILLLQDDYPQGTFLIRNIGHMGTGILALSIRVFDSIKLDHVIHYRILKKPDGHYYITTRRSFVSLQDLITHYSGSSNGLCCCLVKPCPKLGTALVERFSLEIERNDLELKRQLGRAGHFGKFYYGSYKEEMEVTIRLLKPGLVSPKVFLQEAAIMRKCRHKNLLPVYGVCSLGEPLLIVTEFMCNGSLQDYLRSNPEGKACTVTDLIDIAAQIASGMAYLESKNVIHCDLSARNVLVGQNKLVKVNGFNLARIIDDPFMGSKYPIKWTAPEVLHKGKFTIKADVWSFGILLYEIITKGCVPYPAMGGRDFPEQLDLGYRMPKPLFSNCPDRVYQIMLYCWHKDPDKRPTFEYLYTYFDDFSVKNESWYRDDENMREYSLENH